LLTRQLEDGARSKEAKPGTRWQLRRRLAWWLVGGIALRKEARPLGEQDKVERVKRMGKSSEEEQVNLASML
jgi:hypothetical protein